MHGSILPLTRHQKSTYVLYTSVHYNQAITVNFKQQHKTRTNAVYQQRSADWPHDETEDMTARPTSSRTHRRLCQGQTEVVQENPVDLRPVTAGSLTAQSPIMHGFLYAIG